MKIFHEKLDKLDKALYDVVIANPDSSGCKFIVEKLLLFSTFCLASASHIMRLASYEVNILSDAILAGKDTIGCFNAVSGAFAGCSHSPSAMEKETLMNYGGLFADYYAVLHNFPENVSVNLQRAMQQDIGMVSKSTLEQILMFVNAALLVTMHIPQSSYLLMNPDADSVVELMKGARQSVMNVIESLQSIHS